MKRILIFALVVVSLVFGSVVSGYCAANRRSYSLNLDAEKVCAVKLEAASYDKSYADRLNYYTEDRDEIDKIIKNINGMYVKPNNEYKDFSQDGVRYDLTIKYEDKSVIYSVVGTYMWIDYSGGVKYIVNQYEFSAVLRVIENMKAEKTSSEEQ